MARTKAKVFWSGRSQAVRLPMEFRFKGDEVLIRRNEKTGEVILSEKPDWKEIFRALDEAGVPDDFLEGRDREPPQERDLWRD